MSLDLSALIFPTLGIIALCLSTTLFIRTRRETLKMRRLFKNPRRWTAQMSATEWAIALKIKAAK